MATSGPAGPDGLAVVDKAAGWTSHDVVAKARGVLGTRKVGHSGTLDPDATGVLLLGVGKVTRLLRYLGLPAKTLHGRDRARHGHVDPRRVRRGHRHLGHGRRGRRRRCGPRRPRSPATSCRSRRWCRPSRSTVGGCTSWPARASRSSARRDRSRSTASRSSAADRPGLLPDRGRLLVGHLHPVAGRRRGHGARRRRPPARPPAHRHRLVHRRRGRPGRGARPGPPAVAGRGAPRPAGASPCRDAVAADVAHGKVLELDRLGGRRATALAGASTRDGDAPRRLRAPSRQHRQAVGRARACRRSQPRNLRRMQVLHDVGAWPRPDAGSVVTIGAYDGVHLGHQAVIAAVRERAAAGGLESAVVTFDRHPAVGRAPGVGAPPAHRPRPEARAARRHRRRPLPRDLLRRGPLQGAGRGVRAGGAGRLPRPPRSSSSGRTSTSATSAAATSPCCARWAPTSASRSRASPSSTPTGGRRATARRRPRPPSATPS